MPEDKEEDDDLHKPETLVNGKLVDTTAPPSTWKDNISWRAVVNLGSLVLLVTGILILL